MNALTQIALLDDCIDGDKEKLDALLGAMYDQFYCFYCLLENREVQQENPVSFTKEGNVAIFECSSGTTFHQDIAESLEKDYKVAVHTSKKKTNVRIEQRQRRGGRSC